MSTRYTKTILVDNKIEKIDLIRDGFNVFHPNSNLNDGLYVVATKTELFEECWRYRDNLLGDRHMAIFEKEKDASDYMVYRIQKWRNHTDEEQENNKDE